MTYILDTNAVSEVMRAHSQVANRLERCPKEEVLIPPPVMAEIAYGIGRLPRSKRKDSLRAQFELVSREVGRCAWTDEVSEHFGTIKATLERRGDRIEDFDIAIASHALAAGAVLVTANVAHMGRIPGLTCEDWSKDI